MPRTNKAIDASADEIESAKETAVSLIADSDATSAIGLFYADRLEEVEAGIRRLNDFSNKSWLLSAILLYTLVYNKSLYAQSGLGWAEYSRQARERLGLDPRDITEQLSAARFFVKNHRALERAGFDPAGSNRKLARAELAADLCGDVRLTIRHLVGDTWQEYKDWYSSYKLKKAPPPADAGARADVRIDGGKFMIGGVEAVRISDSIQERDKKRLAECIKKIFEAMRQGYEPAVVAVYDKKEGALLERLRDRYRRGR